MKKKLLTVFIALVLCVSLTAILVACGGGDGNAENPGGSGRPVQNPKNMSTTQLVAFSAATTGNMLYAISSGAGGAAGIAAAADGNALTEAEIDSIDEQIAFIESFIGSNPIQIEVVSPVDKIGYEFQVKISTTDLAGNLQSYMLYYNQIANGTSIPDLDDDDDDDDIDELETETSFSLSGLMVVGGQEYNLIGKKTTEIEGNEIETELEIEAIDQSGLNRIVFEQSAEQEGTENEQEFEYKIYARATTAARWGVPVKTFSLELENENGEQEIELKSSDAASGSLRFEKEIENNKTVIKVVQKKSAEVKVIKVKIIDGKYTYHINGVLVGERVHAPIIPPAQNPVTPDVPVTEPTV